VLKEHARGEGGINRLWRGNALRHRDTARGDKWCESLTDKGRGGKEGKVRRGGE